MLRDYGGLTLNYADAASLRSAWKQIMFLRIYDIGTMEHRPTLLDCGANIGLAQLYWKIRYGKYKSIAWEPDPEIAEILRKNLSEWGLEVELREAALGAQEGAVGFISSGDDAGHVVNTDACDIGKNLEVQVERLSPFLDEPVDLLKLDIEGSEWEVLAEIQGKLGNVRNLFLEFHHTEGSDDIGNLLAVLEQSGFYYVVEDYTPHWRTPPFCDPGLATQAVKRCGHVYAKRLANRI